VASDWTSPRRATYRSGWNGRALLVVAVSLLLALIAFAIAVLVWSGVSLASGGSALANVSVDPFGGTIEHVRAFGKDGKPIPITVSGGALTPKTKIAPGEAVTVEVVVRRPGWDGWALGSSKRERLTVRAPAAQVSDRWLTVPPGQTPRVRFDEPVAAVAYGHAGKLSTHSLASRRDAVSLESHEATGTVLIAAAPRSWERIGNPIRVAWFPATSKPVVVASPAPGSHISPSTKIRLMFSKPVSEVLGSTLPQISGGASGRWRRIDSHTLEFSPSGFGIPFASDVKVQLPHALDVAGRGGSSRNGAAQLSWYVPAGSTLRLQQLLAEAGYLPLDWTPSGAAVAHTVAAEVSAAVKPPAGSFSWRYGNTPSALEELWSEGEANTMTKGAVMSFEDEHGLTVDGLAGREVWKALINAAIAGKQHSGGYSYVYVHREVPETLNLWHDGRTVLETPANTGIEGAETELGTFPVFEHIPEGTMEGTNPDGSHYKDEGIKWISYFNGGDAIHNFDRASFGTPQSLGCVELPLQASAEVWPYTPIGTLVTIAG
jgi:L,D-transpeptidase catalytic domain